MISANIGHLLANELLQKHEHRKPGLRLTLGLHKTLLWSEDDVVDGQPKEEREWSGYFCDQWLRSQQA